MLIKKERVGGARVAQSVKGPTLGFGSGRDLRVMGWSPASCSHAQQGVCLGFSPSPSVPPPAYVHPVTLK